MVVKFDRLQILHALTQKPVLMCACINLIYPWSLNYLHASTFINSSSTFSHMLTNLRNYSEAYSYVWLYHIPLAWLLNYLQASTFINSLLNTSHMHTLNDNNSNDVLMYILVQCHLTFCFKQASLFYQLTHARLSFTYTTDVV